MTKFELIDQIIVNLNSLTIQGVENFRIVLTTIQNLSVLKDGLKKEEEARAKQEEKPEEKTD